MRHPFSIAVRILLLVGGVPLLGCGSSVPHKPDHPTPPLEAGEPTGMPPQTLGELAPGAWQVPAHRAAKVLFEPQEHLVACIPWLEGLPQPCSTSYRAHSTTLESFCRYESGALSQRLITYSEHETDPATRHPERFERDRDGIGNIVVERRIDEDGRTTECHFEHDAEGRVVWRACDSDRHGAHFVYDELGRVSERYDTDKYEKDLDALRAWLPPNGRGYWAYVHEYEYDDYGRLSVHRKCNGQTPRWCYFEALLHYDAQGKLRRVESSKEEDTEPSSTTAFTYDGAGRLIAAEENGTGWMRITEIGYDPMGRAVSKHVRTHQASGVDTYTVEARYDGPACIPSP